MTGLALITPAAIRPVTASEAKLFCRVDHAAEDALFDTWIKARTLQVEEYLHRALIDQTWELALDSFTCDEFEIPLPPLISVTSIKYDDESATEQTLSSSAYQVLTTGDRGRIRVVSGESWPATMHGKMGSVRIRFRAGYGTTAGSVPEPIIETILKLVSISYRYRDEAPAYQTPTNRLVDMVLSEISAYQSLRF